MARSLLLLLLLLFPAMALPQGMPFGAKSRLLVVMMPDAKRELKITKDQDKKIQERIKKMTEDMQKGTMPPGFSFTDGPDINFEDILDDAQRTRLEELFIQANGGFALADAKVAAKLVLTEEQLAKVKDIKSEAMRELMQDMQKARSTTAVKELQRKREEHALKAEAVLTADQKNAYDGLKGKPFKFRT